VAAGDTPEQRLAEELRVPVLQTGELEQLRAAAAKVRVSEAIGGYIVNLTRQTRQHAQCGLAQGRERHSGYCRVAGSRGSR